VNMIAFVSAGMYDWAKTYLSMGRQKRNDRIYLIWARLKAQLQMQII
jgi:hypothetical protein